MGETEAMTAPPIAARGWSVGLHIKNEVLRQGLKALLERVPGLGTIHIYGDRAEGRPVSDRAPDVLIVTPAEQPFLERVLRESPSRPKVLLLVHEEHTHHLDSLGSLPVDGVLLQEELSAEVLADAMYRLSIGQAPMPARLVQVLLGRGVGDGGFSLHGRRIALTARELETLGLLADGMSNKLIARALGVSSHGAKRLVGSVLMKLGAPNRTTAVVNAIRDGLVDPR